MRIKLEWVKRDTENPKSGCDFLTKFDILGGELFEDNDPEGYGDVLTLYVQERG